MTEPEIGYDVRTHRRQFGYVIFPNITYPAYAASSSNAVHIQYAYTHIMEPREVDRYRFRGIKGIAVSLKALDKRVQLYLH